MVKHISELILNACFFITAAMVRLLGKDHDWFDGSIDLIISFVGIISGILMIRWLIVRTRCTKIQTKIDTEEKKYEIEERKLQISILKLQLKEDDTQ